MLLTNVAVAEQVAVNFPEQALLRRNDAPLERRLVRDRPPLSHSLLIHHTERVPGAGGRPRIQYRYHVFGEYHEIPRNRTRSSDQEDS